MGASVSIDWQGLPEVRKMLAQFNERELNNRTRRALRAGAKVMRDELRREGRRSDLPRTFRKTRTRSHRNPLGVSVAPASPLSPIFEHGARSHEIGRGGAILANRDTSASFFARGPVRHPGMAARPVIAPAFARGEDRATRAFGDVLFEGID